MFRSPASYGASTLVFCCALSGASSSASAQTPGAMLPTITVEAPARKQVQRSAKKPRRQAAAARPRVMITTAAGNPPSPAGSGSNAAYAPPPVKQRFQLPQESHSITAKQIEETISLKDAEDAVKYMPSLFVRKRNDGDNQAVLATRTWGLNSSARSLIYYDDLLVSALIANNNQSGAPHWNLIAPEAIARVDFLDGPFAAAYPGNSIGGVLIFTTKMPDHLIASVKETVSIMPWSQYGTKDTYVSSQTSAVVGDRQGRFSWLLSATYQDSYQQPLTYTTNKGIPKGTTGAFPALNKQGIEADVVGTGALFMNNVDDMVNCPDSKGQKVGLPDVPVVTLLT